MYILNAFELSFHNFFNFFLFFTKSFSLESPHLDYYYINTLNPKIHSNPKFLAFLGRASPPEPTRLIQLRTTTYFLFCMFLMYGTQRLSVFKWMAAVARDLHEVGGTEALKAVLKFFVPPLTREINDDGAPEEVRNFAQEVADLVKGLLFYFHFMSCAIISLAYTDNCISISHSHEGRSTFCCGKIGTRRSAYGNRIKTKSDFKRLKLSWPFEAVSEKWSAFF